MSEPISPFQTNAWCAEHAAIIEKQWSRQLFVRATELKDGTKIPAFPCDWGGCKFAAEFTTDSESLLPPNVFTD